MRPFSVLRSPFSASLILLCGIAVSSSEAQTVRRVVWNAVYEDPEFVPDGSNWTTQAFPSLQWAIDVSSPGDLIFVKGSKTASTAIYRPNDADGFQLTKSVGIYGGFAGENTQEGIGDADPSVYFTYLDGEVSPGKLAYHVVHLAAASPTISGFTIRNGFANCANCPGHGLKGGGLYVYIADGNYRPVIKFCTIADNVADDGGGGAYVVVTGTLSADAGPIFEDCTFANNVARKQGGGAVVQTNLTAALQGFDRTAFTRCSFVGNKLDYVLTDYDCATSVGAGMFICGNPVLADCSFYNNGPWNGVCDEILINGGGVAIENYVSATQNYTAEFHNCVFRGNKHSQIQLGCPSDRRRDFIHHGGGVYIQRPLPVNPFPQGYPTVLPTNDAEFYDCKFIDNVAANGGGAFMDRAAALFDGCEFMGNDADGRSAHVYDDGPEPPQGSGNDVCDSYNAGSGIPYVQIQAAYGGGAISTYRLSYFEVIGCKFVRNTASLWSGGAIYVYQGATMNADRCYFVGNTAPSPYDDTEPYTNLGPGTGGAIWVNSECLNGLGQCVGSGIGTEHAVSNVYNSLFVGNFAEGEGGALYIEKAGQSTLVNCTIMYNDAGLEPGAGDTGGVLADSERLPEYLNESCVNIVKNSILWGNSDGDDPNGETLTSQLYDELLSVTPAPNPPAQWPSLTYSAIQDEFDDAGDPYESTAFHNMELIPGIPSTNVYGGNGWDGPAVYLTESGVTTFSDSAASFPLDLAGRILKLDPVSGPDARTLIVSSTLHTLVVLGNYADYGAAAYEVEHYAIGPQSPCKNTGSNAANAKLFDIRGEGRVDSSSGVIDIGCYENWFEIP